MPSKKKKYNARFPSGRIKKIMQTDEEIGKVAQAVPVIISRTLELFVKSLLTKAMAITAARNAKTLTPSHMKQCILSESRFDFLKDLVKALPDATTVDGDEPCTPTSNSSISSNFNSPAAERRQADRSLRNSRQSSETQPRSSSFRNGAGPNFYIENTEACPSFRSSSNEYHPSSSVIGPVDESEEEESEEETKPVTTMPATFPPLSACTQVDEDYDT